MPILLDNDQPDAYLLYFTIYLLHSSTCFEHYMLVIRRSNCTDATSGIVLLHQYILTSWWWANNDRNM